MDEQILYIVKGNRQCSVRYADRTELVDMTPRNFLDSMLVKRFSNCETTEICIRKLFGFGHRTPIFVNKEHLFQPLYSKRHWTQIYLNMYEIFCCVPKDDGTIKIVFTNKVELDVDVTYEDINKLRDNCREIKKYMLNNYERDF